MRKGNVHKLEGAQAAGTHTETHTGCSTREERTQTLTHINTKRTLALKIQDIHLTNRVRTWGTRTASNEADSSVHHSFRFVRLQIVVKRGDSVHTEVEGAVLLVRRNTSLAQIISG